MPPVVRDACSTVSLDRVALFCSTFHRVGCVVFGTLRRKSPHRAPMRNGTIVGAVVKLTSRFQFAAKITVGWLEGVIRAAGSDFSLVALAALAVSLPYVVLSWNR